MYRKAQKCVGCSNVTSVYCNSWLCWLLVARHHQLQIYVSEFNRLALAQLFICKFSSPKAVSLSTCSLETLQRCDWVVFLCYQVIFETIHLATPVWFVFSFILGQHCLAFGIDWLQSHIARHISTTLCLDLHQQRELSIYHYSYTEKLSIVIVSCYYISAFSTYSSLLGLKKPSHEQKSIKAQSH